MSKLYIVGQIFNDKTFFNLHSNECQRLAKINQTSPDVVVKMPYCSNLFKLSLILKFLTNDLIKKISYVLVKILKNIFTKLILS